jgi:hypothetical protein
MISFAFHMALGNGGGNHSTADPFMECAQREDLKVGSISFFPRRRYPGQGLI